MCRVKVEVLNVGCSRLEHGVVKVRVLVGVSKIKVTSQARSSVSSAAIDAPYSHHEGGNGVTMFASENGVFTLEMGGLC